MPICESGVHLHLYYTDIILLSGSPNTEHCTVYLDMFVILTVSRWLMCMNFNVILITCNYEGLSSHAAPL